VWPFSFERSTGLIAGGIIVGLGLIGTVAKMIKRMRQEPAN
jgi:hypothetical protein